MSRDIFWDRQVEIAKKTLRMPNEILDYLNLTSPTGGMTKERAREILREERKRQAAASRKRRNK